MHKHILLAVIVVSLLLAGCGGRDTLPGPTPWPSPPPNTGPVFDGSPTHLSLEFERSTVGIPTLSQSQETDEPEVAYVRITCTDHEDPYLGNVIYDVLRTVELEPDTHTFSVESEVPAGRGYVIKSIVIQGNALLEVSSQHVVDAPANTITSKLITMEGPQYTLQMPKKMYSGGGLSQIVAKVPDNLAKVTFVYVWMGLNPWTENGGFRRTNSDHESWLIGHDYGFLPEVATPSKLYYQVGVGPMGDLFPRDEIRWPYHYEPNLDLGEELPYIWIYP